MYIYIHIYLYIYIYICSECVCVCTYTYIHIYIYVNNHIYICICYICILKISSDQDAQVPESPPVAPSSKQGVHFYGYQRPCMFISMESKSSLKMEEKHRKNQIIAICLYMWIRKITVNTMDFEVVPHPPKKITADPMSPMAPRQRGTLQIESDRLSWWLLQNADNPNVSFSDGFELYGIYGTQ